MIRCMSAPLSSPRARSLAAALRGARTEAGLGQRELARQLGIQHPQLSYWERGQRLPKVEDVSAILAKLNIVGDERDRILELARNASEPNWLTANGMSPALAGVLDCERTARSITTWAHAVIPGLLQVSPYARAIIAAGVTPANKVESLVMMRMGRRDILTRPSPISFNALISEAALREVIGSPEVQASQLRHILAMAERPNIDIRIVQPGHGWHPGMVGSFVIYDFANSPSIVHIEHYSSSAFVYEEHDVEAFQAAARVVRGVAMSPTHSTELIASVITELETTT
jgi:transcriptional regulator with XRE-family HTH domain